mmetsp:Transcript_32442/g.52542  ORF Transcript_32442/g.52542 Transcript_32442/m.52542 type:complete len:87 (-) Transcript_32442:1049-1309(-)
MGNSAGLARRKDAQVQSRNQSESVEGSIVPVAVCSSEPEKLPAGSGSVRNFSLHSMAPLQEKPKPGEMHTILPAAKAIFANLYLRM